MDHAARPFWEDDDRQHSKSDYLECKNDIVTETGLGEAAWHLFHKMDCGTVSMNPSSWLSKFLTVDWHENGDVKSISVPNYLDAETLANLLETVPNKPFHSWEELEQTAKNRCPELNFSPESFEPLRDRPFVKSAAYQLLRRLDVLQEFKNCFDENGKRTTEGQKIYQKYFTGNNAWFSDSSDTEKAKFKEKLTFYPSNVENPLFCSWHGKVKTSQLRIHFSWPIQSRQPLYIVYVGPKITKR